MSKSDIQAQIFALREKQANVPANERQAINEEIKRLYKLMDSIKE